MPTETHFRACNFCEAIYGLKISHENDQVPSIIGDDQDFFSRDHICPKAVVLKDTDEDPNRSTSRYSELLFDKGPAARYDWEISEGLRQRLAGGGAYKARPRPALRDVWPRWPLAKWIAKVGERRDAYLRLLVERCAGTRRQPRRDANNDETPTTTRRK